MSEKAFGGIDPGKDGCLAVIRPGGAVEFFDVPMAEVEMSTKTKSGNKKRKRVYLLHEMVAMLRAADLGLVTIERVQAMPTNIPGFGVRKQGTVSAFSSGEGFGIWQGILAALEIPYQVVAAATWKAQLLAGQPKTKEAVVPAICRLYPAAAPHLRGPKGGLHVDRADALFLAHFGRTGRRPGDKPLPPPSGDEGPDLGHLRQSI